MLLELTAALALLAVGLLAHAALTSVGHAHLRYVDESRLALHAARAKVEELRGGDFDTLFVAYNETTIDDPPDAPGAHFDVVGLTASGFDADGRVGRVRFAVDPGDVVPALREDLDLPDLGLPFDIDGDGLIDSLPKNSSYVHLPVLIEIRWRGVQGDRILRLPTWLTRLR